MGTSELKSKLCNYLIQNNLVKEGQVIMHSYTNNRLNGGGKMINTVQNSNVNICPALTTRPDCMGICVKKK